jgi:Ni,Fe-hydrogenase I large subunit
MDAERGFRASHPDRLSETDDAAVITAFLAQGDAFAARPILPERVVETGSFARHGKTGKGLGGRVAARWSDVQMSLQSLAALLRGAPRPTLFQAGRLEGHGYAAVETPRGRLYHLVRLDGPAIADYRLLAPTEWNFHPQGPFAAMLRGSCIGEGETAKLRIAKLAALFDPCIACHIQLHRVQHA